MPYVLIAVGNKQIRNTKNGQRPVAQGMQDISYT